MTYRPDGWKNPYPNSALVFDDKPDLGISYHIVFEAGADAMLEALRKEGRKVEAGRETFLVQLQGVKTDLVLLPGSVQLPDIKTKGILVLIPDDVKRRPLTWTIY